MTDVPLKFTAHTTHIQLIILLSYIPHWLLNVMKII